MWEELVATQAGGVREHGGAFWLTKRLWAERPLRDWLWVEGDDPRVRWTALRRGLGKLHIESETGGADGFYKIPDTPENRKALGGGAGTAARGVKLMTIDPREHVLEQEQQGWCV